MAVSVMIIAVTAAVVMVAEYLFGPAWLVISLWGIGTTALCSYVCYILHDER